MNVGPLGMVGSIAGTPLSQTRGSEADKAVEDAAQQVRSNQARERAENAAGIGETEQDSEANDRDADGRRLWEAPPPSSAQDEEEGGLEDLRRSKDPTGVSGNTLDLSG